MGLGSVVAVGAVVDGSEDVGPVVMRVNDGTGETVGLEVSTAVALLEATRVGAIVSRMLPTDCDGGVVPPSVIDGDVVISPISDGGVVDERLSPVIDGDTEIPPISDGDEVVLDHMVVGMNDSVGEFVGDEPANSVELVSVDATAGSSVGIDSPTSTDPSSTSDSNSVEPVEFVGNPPAYCSQYGHFPSAKHSSKDSDMPEHPSKEESSVIPSRDAA